jgi:hypothetical protein
MNERTKDLWQQAAAAADEIFDRKGKMYGEIVMEKFAQLIAEDCARVLDEDSYIIPELGGYAHDIRTRYGVK